MSPEARIENAAALQEDSYEEGVVIDVNGWSNVHKLSLCLATAYVVYYLLVIVRVRHCFIFRVKLLKLNVITCGIMTFGRRTSQPCYRYVVNDQWYRYYRVTKV